MRASQSHHGPIKAAYVSRTQNMPKARQASADEIVFDAASYEANTAPNKYRRNEAGSIIINPLSKSSSACLGGARASRRYRGICCEPLGENVVAREASASAL